MSHNNRVVLVTGALGGIGSAMVEQYLQEGAAVGMIDLDQQKGQALAKKMQEAGKKVFFVAADVGNFSDCQLACDQIQASLGAIDTVINNAGISPKHNGAPMPIWKMDPTEWLRVMDVNLNSIFNFSRILVPGMVEKKFGRIVSMSSVAGQAYCEIVAAHYAATKAAVIGMTRHLAAELGPDGITVNAIAPGRIDTPLVAGSPKEYNDAIVALTPLRRMGTPSEVADTCLFLTSDKAKFVTGQVIDVAGGWLMT